MSVRITKGSLKVNDQLIMHVILAESQSLQEVQVILGKQSYRQDVKIPLTNP